MRVEFHFRWKTVPAILLILAVTILMVNFVPKIGILYSELSDNAKHFVSTSVAAGIGILLFVLKKRLDHKIKDLEKKPNLSDIERSELDKSKQLSLTAELYEILIFLIMPGLALYGLFPDQIKETPEWIPIIFSFFAISWYVISLIYIGRNYKEGDGKIVYTHVHTFFVYSLVIIVGSLILIIYLRSLGIFNN